MLKLGIAALASCAVVILIASMVVTRSEAVASLGLVVPLAKGEVGYVCQGYNTSSSHKSSSGDRYGLDIVFDKRAIGTNGCKSGFNSAQGHAVLSPAAGTIVWSDRPTGLLCMKVSGSNMSLKIGHLDTSSWKASGSVAKQTRLGVVAAPNSGNARIPHIHISVYSDSSCRQPIPFRTSNGTELNGHTMYFTQTSEGDISQVTGVDNVWNLTSSGAANQWRGKALWSWRAVAR